MSCRITLEGLIQPTYLGQLDLRVLNHRDTETQRHRGTEKSKAGMNSCFGIVVADTNGARNFPVVRFEILIFSVSLW